MIRMSHIHTICLVSRQGHGGIILVEANSRSPSFKHVSRASYNWFIQTAHYLKDSMSHVYINTHSWSIHLPLCFLLWKKLPSNMGLEKILLTSNHHTLKWNKTTNYLLGNTYIQSTQTICVSREALLFPDEYFLVLSDICPFVILCFSCSSQAVLCMVGGCPLHRRFLKPLCQWFPPEDTIGRLEREEGRTSCFSFSSGFGGFSKMGSMSVFSALGRWLPQLMAFKKHDLKPEQLTISGCLIVIWE